MICACGGGRSASPIHVPWKHSEPECTRSPPQILACLVLTADCVDERRECLTLLDFGFQGRL